MLTSIKSSIVLYRVRCLEALALFVCKGFPYLDLSRAFGSKTRPPRLTTIHQTSSTNFHRPTLIGLSTFEVMSTQQTTNAPLPQPATETEVKILDHQVHTANAFAILSTLFAGVQAQLLSGIPDDTASNYSRRLIGSLQFFSYGGLVINISAALSAIFFISLANLERDDSGRVRVPPNDVVGRGLDRLRHFFLTLTFLGTYFIFLQISLLTWTAKNRSNGVFAVVIAVIWVSFIPLTAYTKAVIHRKRR